MKPSQAHSESEATRLLLKSPVLWGLTLVRGFRAMALVALVAILPVTVP